MTNDPSPATMAVAIWPWACGPPISRALTNVNGPTAAAPEERTTPRIAAVAARASAIVMPDTSCPSPTVTRCASLTFAVPG